MNRDRAVPHHLQRKGLRNEMANEKKTESSKGPRLTWKQKKELGRRIWSDSPGLEVVHRDAAGIDIGSREHYVAVGPDRDAQPVRNFS